MLASFLIGHPGPITEKSCAVVSEHVQHASGAIFACHVTLQDGNVGVGENGSSSLRLFPWYKKSTGPF
jgi:hypothetical protein